jgi:hypothetical protein
VTKLLQDLRNELVRRDYAATTIRSYVQIVEAFRQHTGARLDRITPAHLRRYHLFLLEERRLTVGTVVAQISVAIFTDSLEFRARVLANQNGKRRSMINESDREHGSASSTRGSPDGRLGAHEREVLVWMPVSTRWFMRPR